MTAAELALALDRDLSSKRPPPGETPITNEAEREAYIAKVRSQTPRQRLEETRRKWW